MVLGRVVSGEGEGAVSILGVLVPFYAPGCRLGSLFLYMLSVSRVSVSPWPPPCSVHERKAQAMSIDY